jgi:hypothetical protein
MTVRPTCKLQIIRFAPSDGYYLSRTATISKERIFQRAEWLAVVRQERRQE